MQQQSLLQYWLKVVGSIVVALCLAALPLPAGISEARPHALLLVLCFWAMNPPHRVGILTAFVCGILLDVLIAHVMGEHALLLMLCVYVAHKFQRQMLMFPILQQVVVMMIVAACYQALTLLIQGMLGELSLSSWYWLAPVSTGLMWWLLMPWLNHRAIAHNSDFFILKH